MVEIKNLTGKDISSDMLLSFNHHQVIAQKWVSRNNRWELTAASDLREWDREKRIWIAAYLSQQVERGGSAIAAFEGDVLAGFCSVDGGLSGNTAKYANLTMLFVDDNWKRKGIGRKLFERICMYAAKMNADKIFVSAIPSFETVAFYFDMGCKDAEEIISEYVDTDRDRYLEHSLTELV